MWSPAGGVLVSTSPSPHSLTLEAEPDAALAVEYIDTFVGECLFFDCILRFVSDDDVPSVA